MLYPTGIILGIFTCLSLSFGCNDAEDRSDAHMHYRATIGLVEDSRDIRVDLSWHIEQESQDSILFSLGSEIEVHSDHLETVGRNDRDTHYRAAYNDPIQLTYTIPEEAIISLPDMGYLEVSHQHHWLPDITGERYRRPFTYALEYAGPASYAAYAFGARSTTAETCTLTSRNPTTVASLFFTAGTVDTVTSPAGQLRAINLVDSLRSHAIDSVLTLGDDVLSFYTTLFADSLPRVPTLFVCPTGRASPASRYSYATEEMAFRLAYADDITALEYPVSHEMAHFWWHFGSGGNDGPNGFINESFAQYNSLLYYRNIRGERAFRNLIGEMLASLNGKPLSMYGDEYYATPDATTTTLYGIGSLILLSLHDRLGDEAFYTFLRAVLTERPQTLPELASWIAEHYPRDERYTAFLRQISP